MIVHDDLLPDDYPLPEWAIKKSNGDYMEIGAQLCTRDGRNCGNAFVNNLQLSKHAKHEEAVIITDAGTKLVMDADELKEFFFPPRYVMNPEEAQLKFCNIKSEIIY